MAEGRKLGLVAALEVLAPQTGLTQGRLEALEVMRAEQLALLPTPAAIEEAGAPDDVAERAGPGRPPGSRNRRTEDMVRFVLGSRRHPMLFLADTYTRPTKDIAAQLNCTMEEAYKLQLVAAKELLPYVASKMPVAAEIDDKGELHLHLVRPEPAPAAASRASITIQGKVEEDQ